MNRYLLPTTLTEKARAALPRNRNVAGEPQSERSRKKRPQSAVLVGQIFHLMWTSAACVEPSLVERLSAFIGFVIAGAQPMFASFRQGRPVFGWLSMVWTARRVLHR